MSISTTRAAHTTASRSIAVCATAALTVGAAFGLAAPAQAAEVRPTEGALVKVWHSFAFDAYTFEGAAHEVSTRDLTALFGIDSDGDGAVDSYAYCIEVDVHIDPWNVDAVDFLNDDDVPFSGNAFFANAEVDGVHVRDRVSDIIDTGYPNVPVAALGAAAGVSGLSEYEAIAATQGAIWSYSDAIPTSAGWQDREYLSLVKDDGADQYSGSYDVARVLQVVDYLKASSDDATAMPRVDLFSDIALSTGNAGPVIVSTNQPAVILESNYVLVDAEGNPVDPMNVADGTALYAQIPADATDAWELEARTTAVSHANQVVVARQSQRQQTLVLTGNEGPAIDRLSIPLADLPVEETPEVPVEETPVTPETPEVPEEETPEVPEEETPVEETPETPETPEVPEEETPEVPVEETPVEETPVEETPEAPETPEVPEEETPVEETPETPETPEAPEEEENVLPEAPEGDAPVEETPEEPAADEPVTEDEVVVEEPTADEPTTEEEGVLPTAPVATTPVTTGTSTVVFAPVRSAVTHSAPVRSAVTHSAPARATLARTGDEVGMLVGAGLVLLFAGGAAVLSSRRRAQR